MSTKFKNFISNQIKRFPHQPEFVQAVTEVAESVIPFISENKKYDNMDLIRSIKTGNIRDASFSKRELLQKLFYDVRERFRAYNRRKK